MRRLTEPSCAGLVLEALIANDDFTNATMLQKLTGLSRDRICAAVAHLRKYRAVDVIIQPDGVGWWFATPSTDTRIYVIKEHAAGITRNRRLGHKRGKK